MKASGQSDASEVWFLFYSCIRGYFKELRKVRAPAPVASNMSSVTDRAGTYLWAMVQAHRITQEFISHRWREHPSIAGVVNYHLFCFTVPLSVRNKLKEEVSLLKKNELDRQSELSKLVPRVKALERKKISASPTFFLLFLFLNITFSNTTSVYSLVC